MPVPSVENAREWAARSARSVRGGRAVPRGRGRAGLLGMRRAAMRRRRRQRWLRGTRGRLVAGLGSRGSAPRRKLPSLSLPMPTLPTPPSLRRPSLPRPSLRRRRSRMAGKLGMAVGAGAGYVLGSQAGRERYQQIVDQARQLWQRQDVQDLAAKGRDRVGTGVERAAGRAGDRLQQAREEASRSG